MLIQPLISGRPTSIGSATVADAIANYIVGKFGIGSVTGLIINAMEVQHDVVAIC